MCYRIAPSTVLIVLLLVSACQSRDLGTPVGNIGDRGGGAYHVVQKGETLYSIAWRYGLDYKDLAATNGISPPYTIYVEQKIKLRGARRRAATPAPPAKEDGPPRRQATRSTPSMTRSVQGQGSVAWHWPLTGKIIGSFSLQGTVNKGVDIEGKRGEPVRSAADGVVVYAGGGLRGYGKLVIVKHNARFLSAYAHNRAILVKEGDTVKAGQVVARVGSSGAVDTDRLHFEIRKDGKPQDPLKYLPPR